MHRIPKMLVPLLALSFVAAACNGEQPAQVDEEQTETQTQTGTEAGSPSPENGDDAGGAQLEGTVNDRGTATLEGDQLEMELDNFYFEPTFVEAPGGSTVSVELTNEGEAAHTFTIDSLNIDQELQPGESRTVEVELPEEGQLVFYCRFHDGQGMKGAFNVQ